LCVNCSDEAEAGPVKKQKLDDDLEGGMEDITKAEVTEVGCHGNQW
jgi:hypothetical protein